MIKAKRRYVAYVFFTLALLLLVINLLVSQKKYSESNWFVTVEHGDEPKIYVFYPNIPYTIKSDDYILYWACMSKKNDNYIVEYSESYGAPEGSYKILGGYPGQVCLKTFNITCKDTTYFTLNVQLSGFIFESGHYEIHKGVSEGKTFFYNNSKRHIYLANNFKMR
ncbi:MAG: hypothetical protein ACYDA4_14430 [Ignavibacteriaceae bacterium]